MKTSTGFSYVSRKAPVAPPACEEDALIQRAITLLERRVFRAGAMLSSPDAVRNYLRLTLVQEPDEAFVAVFLNARFQVIACETLFKGTVDSTSVYPRVVARKALEYNAVALIVAHQHPSGHLEPSQADKALTTHLKNTLALIDVKLLDHFIIGNGEPFSFANAGLL